MLSKNLTQQFINLYKKAQKYIYIIVSIVALVVIGSLIIKGMTRTTKGDLQSSSGVKTQLQGEFKTFTSQNLGISFDYASGPNDQRVLTKQIDNKVYLYVNYTKKDDPTS